MAQILEIHLLCTNKLFSKAFEKAARELHLNERIKVTLQSSRLSEIPSSTKFDLIVSPANSYGRLDGGFDDAISRAFAPADDYHALTRVAQATLYEEWHGFAPPGTCTLVRIPDDFNENSMNVWDTKYLALCPTMRFPQDVRWNREIVYDCIWSLLCVIDKHNRAATKDELATHGRIESILMTPIATGTGFVSPERWAEQLVLSINHFVDSMENAAAWKSLQWKDVAQSCREVENTWTRW